jgi:BASS family bile acid:Na+ symporter
MRSAILQLKNTSIILVLSILFGLALPGPAEQTMTLITPALLIMMAFSLTEVRLDAKSIWSAPIGGSVLGLALNYGLLSGLILLLAWTMPEGALRNGFIVMAATPPAVAVLPMTRLLKGDVRLTLYAESLSYLASMLLMPAIIFASTRQTAISPGYMLQISVLLILLPAIASRFVRRLSLDSVLPINLGFFLVTYTVIGLNQGALWTDIGSVAWIALARTFVIGLLVFASCIAAGIGREQAISYMLFGSYKNLGMAAAVSLMLFGPEAGVPAAFCVLAETVFFLFLCFFLAALSLYKGRNGLVSGDKVCQ